MPDETNTPILEDYNKTDWYRGKVIKVKDLKKYEEQIDILTDNVLNIDNRLVDFVGANSTTDGVKGVVPAPRAGDENKYLKGDGSWETPAAKHGTSTGAVAEGIDTEASGEGSHAEGQGTIANHSAQHVFGTYNIAESPTTNANEKGTYIEIVGNGASESERANARTLDWEGNEVLAGGITATSFTGSGAGLTNISGTEVGLATSSAAGAMSSADKVKLDELPTNTQLQTNYVSKSSVSDASGIPNADTTQYGLVKIGSNINVDNGTISIPLATSSVSGIVSVGNGLSVDNGIISNNLNIKNGAGNYSIIAGDSNNVASANYSYAIGLKTVAQKECQYVFGKYNKIDTSTDGTFVEIVGNGELGARSNARTLDWDGNEWVAGNITANGSITANSSITTSNFYKINESIPIGMTSLWSQNATTLGEVTFTLNLTFDYRNYNLLVVKFLLSTAAPGYKYEVVIPDSNAGKQTIIYLNACPNENALYSRNLYLYSSTVNNIKTYKLFVEDGYQRSFLDNTHLSNSLVCVPMEIYGIKL